MSVINQMLNELEVRRAAEQEKAGLPNLVRPLPQVGNSRIKIGLMLGVGLLLVVIGTLVVWNRLVANKEKTTSESMTGYGGSLSLPRSYVNMGPASNIPTQVLTSDHLTVINLPRVGESEPVQSKNVSKPTKTKTHDTETRQVKQSKKITPIESKTSRILASNVTAPDSVVVDKQVKAPTSKQLAENEFRRALGLISQGKINEGIGDLYLALSHDPQHTVARQTLASLLNELQRNDEAQKVLEEGLSIDVNQPKLAMMLARILVVKGDAAAAWNVLQQTLPAAREAEYYGYAAAVLQRLGRHQEAIQQYQTALRFVPDSGIWWMGLGISFHALDKQSEAKEAFKNAQTANLSPELQVFVEDKLRQLR